jgi:zinc/manganese transport system substrate-binding protein
MQKKSKIAIVVAVVIIIAGAGLAEAYVLSVPPNPCAGVTTPTSPSEQTSISSTGAESGTGSSASVAGSAAPPTLSSAPAVATAPAATPKSSGLVINVVAAENFWGSLVSQIGGTHVSVLSIITDPNTDPHEYQSNSSDAVAFSNAQYIILNNVGYDEWGTELVASDGNSHQTVLNIGDYLGVSVTGGIVTGNPHLWYNPVYVNQTVAWMYHNLTTIATSLGWGNLTGYFTDQYNNVTASLTSLYDEVGAIKGHFAGTVVSSTESIFVYLANATGLNLVSPPAFMEAVAEGSDPSDSSIVTFQCQLESGHVRVLVYNLQTVTPITTNMKAIAASNNVTVIGVTETVQPVGTSFQSWMYSEYIELYNALNANTLGQ